MRRTVSLNRLSVQFRIEPLIVESFKRLSVPSAILDYMLSKLRATTSYKKDGVLEQRILVCLSVRHSILWCHPNDAVS